MQGNKYASLCVVKKTMENNDVIVYRLGAGCDLSDIEEGNVYQAKVQGFATFGMFAQMNDRIKGLVHKSNVKSEHKERDPSLYGYGKYARMVISTLKKWSSRSIRSRRSIANRRP